MACKKAAQYITIYQWRDNKPKFIHGEYWGMVGGNSRSADIVRCTANKQRLEKYNIKECTGKTFNSGHHVYVTNSNGRTCYITVTPPKPAITLPETPIVEITPEPLQVYIQPSLPTEENQPIDTLKTDNINTPTIVKTITPITTSVPIETSLNKLTIKDSILLIFGLLVAAIITLKINKKGD